MLIKYYKFGNRIKLNYNKKLNMETKIKQKRMGDLIWIDINHPLNEHIDEIAKDYDLNLFQVKDSLQYGHLPKIEKSENYTFLILRAFSAQAKSKITNINELSNKIAFFYNSGRIITIHRNNFGFLEKVPDHFDSIDDLLLYIIHQMIYSFVEPTNVLSNRVDKIEETIFLKDYTRVSIEELYFQKSETRISKKLLLISQGIINQLEVGECSKSALQDIKDLLLSLILTYEEVAEESNNLLNTYMSVNAQKTNDVIKLLTIFSVFFLPLTFIVGVYGMNFENIPELKWRFGYLYSLVLMVIIAIIIYIWFRRKKIIGL